MIQGQRALKLYTGRQLTYITQIGQPYQKEVERLRDKSPMTQVSDKQLKTKAVVALASGILSCICQCGLHVASRRHEILESRTRLATE